MSDSEELACPKKGGCGKKKSSCKKSGCSGGDEGPSIEKVVSDALGGFVKKHEEIEEKRENAGRIQEKIEDVDKK